MAKKKVDTRQIACAVCGYEHYIKDGGWVILGNKKAICYSLDKRNCYEKMRVLWADTNDSPLEQKKPLGILEEFESW